MKNSITTLVLGLLLAAPLPAFAEINIFACEPEWASLAEEIAGKNAKITSATHAHQDPHHIRAKPSLIAAIRKADIVICSGGGLEVGWLPILLQKASASVQPGAEGYIAVSDHVKMLGVPEKLDRAYGDIHPEGNPHLHLNPHNITKAAKVLSARLQKVDAENSARYKNNLSAFVNKWQSAIKKWEAKAISLKGMPVAVHHKSWLYLESWLGLKRVASLEPVPGIPPTTAHLEEVLNQTKKQPIKAILVTPYEQKKAAEWLSEKAGVPVIVPPYTVGGTDTADTLEALFDETLNLLLKAKS